MYEDYIHPDLQRSKGGREMELDIFIPSKRLAFEYQGEHHFFDVYGLGNHWERKQNDEEKQRVCQEKGITLIQVPYWWDLKKESLMATVYKEREDLMSENIDVNPIPLLNQEEKEGMFG